MTTPDATRTVTVVNSQGLHLRPAEMLAKLCQQFNSRIEIRHQHEAVDAKSIFAIVTLVAMPGTELQFEATGPDAAAALDQIADLFASKFGED
jgi:phosphocarrier protein HPr